MSSSPDGLSDAEVSEQVKDFFDNEYRRHRRYWWLGENRYSPDPNDHVPFHSAWLELAVKGQRAGRVLDIGAGEGSDSIRLAKLGYEVDTVEISEIASQKIEDFAASEGVQLTIHNTDILTLGLTGMYDIVVMNGSLHYLKPAARSALLARLDNVTRPGGLHVVSLFSDHTPVPSPHMVVPVFTDSEGGSVEAHYGAGWDREYLGYDRDKLELSHPGFDEHRHSFIKLLAQKTINERIVDDGAFEDKEAGFGH